MRRTTPPETSRPEDGPPTESEPATAPETPDPETPDPEAPALDTTVYTLTYLRVLRREQHRADTKGTLYALYCAVVLCSMWLAPYLAAAAHAARPGGPDGELARRALAAVPGSLTAVLALVLLSAARTACWHGPVRLEEPAVSWLLPHPVRRTALLLPTLRRSTLFSASVGAAVGGMAGFALQALTAEAWWATTLAGLWAGVVAGLSGTALGVLVQRHQERATRTGARGWPLARCGVLLLVSLAVGSVLWQSTALSWVLLWSGPWGWALLPLTAAAGLAGGWVAVAGCLLTVGTLGGALPLVLRAAPAVPARVLRLQARLATRTTAALYALDLRGARTLARSVHERRVWRGLRVPAPRRRWLLVPWRDLTALLRSPSQVVSTLVRACAGVLLLRLAAQSTGSPSTLAALLALVCAGSAAQRAIVAARLDGEDPRRSVALPWRRGTLALWHAVTPSLLVGVGALTGVAVSAALGGVTTAQLLLLAGAPAFVAAALVTAYQGDMPPHLAIGTDTGLGNTGALNMLFWRCKGPLIVVGAMAAPYLTPFPAPGALVWIAVVTAGALGWVRRAATRSA